MDNKKVGNLLQEICQVLKIDNDVIAHGLKINTNKLEEIFLGNRELEDWQIRTICEIAKYDQEEFKKGESILQNRARSYEEAVLNGGKTLKQFFHYCCVIQGNFRGRDYQNKTVQDYVIDYQSKECLEFLIEFHLIDYHFRMEDLIYLFLKFGFDKELEKIGYYKFNFKDVKGKQIKISDESLEKQMLLVADSNYTHELIKAKIAANYFLSKSYLLALAKLGNKDEIFKQLEFMIQANQEMETINQLSNGYNNESSDNIYQIDSTIYDYVILNEDKKSLELLLKAQVNFNSAQVFDGILFNEKFWAVPYFGLLDFQSDKNVLIQICMLKENVIKQYFANMFLPIEDLIITRKFDLALTCYYTQREKADKIYDELKKLVFNKSSDVNTPVCDSLMQDWRKKFPNGYPDLYGNKIETVSAFLKQLGFADLNYFDFKLETALESKNLELIKLKMQDLELYEKDKVLNNYIEGDLSVIKILLDCGACFLIKGHNDSLTEEDYKKLQRNMTKTNLMKLSLKDL